MHTVKKMSGTYVHAYVCTCAYACVYMHVCLCVLNVEVGTDMGMYVHIPLIIISVSPWLSDRIST